MPYYPKSESESAEFSHDDFFHSPDGSVWDSEREYYEALEELAEYNFNSQDCY